MKQRRIKNPFTAKCFRCEFIRCIDFFQKSKKKDTGGEFYILYRSVRSKFLPCIAGSCIEALCKIGAKLHTMSGDTPQPIAIVLIQTVRDLKCSCFLALNGHYRNAFQTLRPSIENFLAGLYFQYLDSYEDFVKWTEGKYEIPRQLYKEVCPKEEKEGRIKEKIDYYFILRFLVKKEIIESKWQNWISKQIFSELNKYLHPYFPYFETSIGCISCPAVVEYSEEKILEFMKLFQQIVWFIMISLFQMFGFEEFEKDENVKEALKTLTVQPVLVPKLIRSKEYEELLRHIEKRWEKVSHEVKI